MLQISISLSVLKRLAVLFASSSGYRCNIDVQGIKSSPPTNFSGSIHCDRKKRVCEKYYRRGITHNVGSVFS
jgi:hypothetical protein